MQRAFKIGPLGACLSVEKIQPPGEVALCSECNGEGVLTLRFCAACGGSGFVGVVEPVSPSETPDYDVKGELMECIKSCMMGMERHNEDGMLNFEIQHCLEILKMAKGEEFDAYFLTGKKEGEV